MASLSPTALANIAQLKEYLAQPGKLLALAQTNNNKYLQILSNFSQYFNEISPIDLKNIYETLSQPENETLYISLMGSLLSDFNKKTNTQLGLLKVDIEKFERANRLPDCFEYLIQILKSPPSPEILLHYLENYFKDPNIEKTKKLILEKQQKVFADLLFQKMLQDLDIQGGAYYLFLVPFSADMTKAKKFLAHYEAEKKLNTPQSQMLEKNWERIYQTVPTAVREKKILLPFISQAFDKEVFLKKKEYNQSLFFVIPELQEEVFKNDPLFFEQFKQARFTYEYRPDYEEDWGELQSEFYELNGPQYTFSMLLGLELADKELQDFFKKYEKEIEAPIPTHIQLYQKEQSFLDFCLKTKKSNILKCIDIENLSLNEQKAAGALALSTYILENSSMQSDRIEALVAVLPLEILSDMVRSPYMTVLRKRCIYGNQAKRLATFEVILEKKKLEGQIVPESSSDSALTLSKKMKI